MRDEKDPGTIEMDLPRKRGRRPRFGTAMTPAERAQQYRQRRKQDAMHGFFCREVSDAAMIDSLRIAMREEDAELALKLLDDLRSRVRMMQIG